MHDPFPALRIQIPMSTAAYYSAPQEAAVLIGTAILPSLLYGVNSTLALMTICLLWKG